MHATLPLIQEQGLTREVATLYDVMCSTYSHLQEGEEAIRYGKLALEISEGFQPKGAIASSLISLGVAYQTAGDQATALEQFERALLLCRDLKVQNAVVMALCNVLECASALGRFERAEEAIAELDTMEIVLDDIAIYVEVGRSRIQQSHDDAEQALASLLRALDVAEQGNHQFYAAEVHRYIKDLARASGDFELYLAHQDKEAAIREEISGAETRKRLALQDKQRELEAERRAHQAERERERAVLYSTLPQHVADRVVAGEQVTDHFDNASVLFLDIAGFTSISDRIPAGHVVHLLKAIFKVCDDVCKRHGVTRIKTIGDSYMAVAGVPEPLDDHASRAAQAALAMITELNDLELSMDPSLGDTSWTQEVGELNVRIGLHCGPVVAGIVGDEQLQYDVWGDTVNTASRMESTGEPGRVQVSEAFAQLVANRYTLDARGEVDIKGKGSMTTFWLEGA